MPSVHTLVITHTHERIARTLMGLKAQTMSPRSITVAIDGDDPRIEPEIRRAASAIGQPITLVLRTRQAESRRAQNRNNAVRALLERGLDEHARLIFFDGDCIPCVDAVEAHSNALDTNPLSLGWAIRLSEDQTATLSDAQILDGTTDSVLDSKQRSSSGKAHFQTHKRIVMKKFGLTKPHKPGILSGNFGIRLSSFMAVNGFDESFTGWGMEDDDLARRLYMGGVKPRSVMDRAVVFHQYHPTDQPESWHDATNADRLSRETVRRCSLGLDNPMDQDEPVVIRIEP